MTSWAALLVALGAQALLVHRQDEWNRQALEQRCRDLPDLPHAAVYAWISTLFAVVALVAFGRWLWLISQGPPSKWWTAAMPVAGLLALVVLAMFLAVAFTAPTDPANGTDGSGLPCGLP